MNRRHWMVCECWATSAWRNDKPCLFDEDAALRCGDPPRCIRHGALLLGDSTLDGMSRAQVDRKLREQMT